MYFSLFAAVYKIFVALCISEFFNDSALDINDKISDLFDCLFGLDLYGFDC
jgi:hypothetical protein